MALARTDTSPMSETCHLALRVLHVGARARVPLDRRAANREGRHEGEELPREELASERARTKRHTRHRLRSADGGVGALRRAVATS